MVRSDQPKCLLKPIEGSQSVEQACWATTQLHTAYGTRHGTPITTSQSLHQSFHFVRYQGSHRRELGPAVSARKDTAQMVSCCRGEIRDPVLHKLLELTIAIASTLYDGPYKCLGPSHYAH